MPETKIDEELLKEIKEFIKKREKLNKKDN
jgi:hypothetical protein